MAVQFFPKKAPEFNPVDIRELARVLNLPFVTLKTGRKFGILAVRGWYSGKNARGVYDDAIFLIFEDHVVGYAANTDPSAWTVGHAALAGCDITPDLEGERFHGKGRAYKRLTGTGELWLRPGKHKINSPPPRGYPAFRQSKNCTVWRGKSFDTGNFGINLHRGGYRTTSSLGCQTIHPLQWEKFKKSIQSEFKIDDTWVMKNPSGVSSMEFCYLLINRFDMDRITGKTN